MTTTMIETDVKALPLLRKTSLADVGLGVVGAVALVAGIIIMTALFLAFNSYETNIALVLLVCGAVSATVGGISLVMLLAVKALGNKQ